MQDSSSSSSSSSSASSSNSSTSMRTDSYNINNTTTATNYTRLSFEIPTTNQHDTNSSNLTLKPHRSSDFSYSAIAQRRNQLTFRDFRLIRRVGSGDIGTVYLCRLMSNSDDSGDGGGDAEYYAMKVVDREAVAVKKKKAERAEMERKILKMVDHPFLPTLYAEFEASHFSCFVMEFCSGGDLHSLRHRYPHRRFPLPSARFYAAEVLVALEYLHMLGIVYRDLKPENVLVRSDGHIMLSDFDLSLFSDSIAAVESPSLSPPPALHYTKPHPNIIKCVLNWLFRSKKVQNLNQSYYDRQFVAEPVTARSCSFVGTHEYVAPEVASGGSHGNAVDWWAFGIFMYELIYGRTPFVGPTNEATLRNIVKKPLAFPFNAASSTLEMHARDLISGLLRKDPSVRVGSMRGSADIKTHPFFKGLNFALIRTLNPPEVPPPLLSRRQRTTSSVQQRKCKARSTAFDYF